MTSTDNARSLRADDVLSAILVLAAHHLGSGTFQFRAHDSKLQRVFHDLAQSFASIGKTFTFSDSGPEAFSPILNESFARLQLAGLVGRQNPDYEMMFLRAEAAKYYDEILEPALAPEMRDELQQVATVFASQIAVA